MKWWSRLSWFVAGALAFALCSLACSFYRNFVDNEVAIQVANSLTERAHIQLTDNGSTTLDCGDISSGNEFKRSFTISDVGEGPWFLIVDSPTRDEYRLGATILTGKGPYERFVRLTPKGVVAFFYSPSKGGWCGMLDPEPPTTGGGSANAGH